MFKKPFSFKGRIRRLEYGVSSLLIVAGYIIAQGLFYMGFRISPGAGAVFFGIMGLCLYLVLIVFGLSQGAKRSHDIGNSGWFQLIPFYGLALLFATGDNGPNKYGEDPKGNEREISFEEVPQGYETPVNRSSLQTPMNQSTRIPHKVKPPIGPKDGEYRDGDLYK